MRRRRRKIVGDLTKRSATNVSRRPDRWTGRQVEVDRETGRRSPSVPRQLQIFLLH